MSEKPMPARRGFRTRIPTLLCLVVAPVALTLLPVAAGVTLALVATAIIWVNEIVRLRDIEAAQELRWAARVADEESKAIDAQQAHELQALE